MNIAQNWRLNEQRYNLVGSNTNGTLHFPPRPAGETRLVEIYNLNQRTDKKDEVGSAERTLHAIAS